MMRIQINEKEALKFPIVSLDESRNILHIYTLTPCWKLFRRIFGDFTPHSETRVYPCPKPTLTKLT